MIIWDETKNYAERQFLDVHYFLHNQPILITDEHQIVVAVNEEWVRICDFSANEVFGQTPKILQGIHTNVCAARLFVSQIRNGEKAHTVIVNYNKSKQSFRHELTGWQYGDLMIAETLNAEVLHDDSLCTQAPPS